MRRGVILSIDLMIGIVIALSFTALLIYKADITEPIMESNVLLTIKASDALTVLDKSGVIERENLTLIENTLDNIFVFEEYDIEIRYYNENFSSYNLIKTGNVTEKFIAVKHPFHFIENKSRYGIAILRLKS